MDVIEGVSIVINFLWTFFFKTFGEMKLLSTFALPIERGVVLKEVSKEENAEQINELFEGR